jgi:cobaltochelatase CobS
MQTVIKQTIDALRAKDSNRNVWHRDEIVDVARSFGASWTVINERIINTRFRTGRGMYDISLIAQGSQAPAPQLSSATPSAASIPAPAFKLAQAVTSTMNDDVYVPEVDPTYVRWGEYDTVLKAIESRLFYPIYISGLSGNGKTTMVEQACAKVKREYIRVQISPETDEDDLIGGFRLIGGETVFCKGPVLKAMERGCVLLIDEIDRSSNKIMCLQGILEGKPVLVKKTGQVIQPAPGFTVIATANTKGRGSEDGRFAAATIIDEAFLERFVATIDQPYASQSVERKIVVKHMEKFGRLDEQFADMLVAWSTVIRKTFESEAIEEVISTRRLCHIAQTFAIYGDRSQAIKLCIARFDNDTRAAFLDLYSKIDPSIVPQSTATGTPASGTSPGNNNPERK